MTIITYLYLNSLRQGEIIHPYSLILRYLLPSRVRGVNEVNYQGNYEHNERFRYLW